jgi:hypothetical protein
LLDRQKTIVGRNESCHLTIEDPRLSRRHAELVAVGAGHTIEDLGSSNGTRVNGERLAPGQPRLLAEGDVVTLGSTRFRYTSACGSIESEGHWGAVSSAFALDALLHEGRLAFAASRRRVDGALAQAVVSAGTLGGLRRALELVVERFDARVAAAFVAGPETGVQCLDSAPGLEPVRALEKIAARSCITGNGEQDHAPEGLERAATSERVAVDWINAGAVPFSIQGQRVGSIAIARPPGMPRLVREDLAVLAVLAEHVGVAIGLMPTREPHGPASDPLGTSDARISQAAARGAL